MQKEELIKLRDDLIREKNEILATLKPHAIEDPIIEGNYNLRTDMADAGSEKGDQALETQMDYNEKAEQDVLEVRLKAINEQLEHIAAQLENAA